MACTIVIAVPPVPITISAVVTKETSTFQSEIKATECLPCTSGFICPPTAAEAQTGLITPSTCPPGYTCESDGMAFPRDRCPAIRCCKNSNSCVITNHGYSFDHADAMVVPYSNGILCY